MSPFQLQLAKEARWDVRVAAVWLVLFFGCMLVLPRGAFWYYFVPLAAFWVRYLFVRERRDEALLRADFAASGGGCAPGCYATEAGICISDGTHHVLIAGHDPDATIKLPHIIGGQQPGDMTRHALINHSLTSCRAVNQGSAD